MSGVCDVMLGENIHIVRIVRGCITIFSVPFSPGNKVNINTEGCKCLLYSVYLLLRLETLLARLAKLENEILKV